MALVHSVLLVTTLASVPTHPLTYDEGARSWICSNGQVSIEGKLRPNWAAEVERVCLELSSWRNLDPDVHVRLRGTPTTLGLDARSGDGRTASREVLTPQALRPTLKALMTLPTAVTGTPPAGRERPITPITNDVPTMADAPVTRAQVARPNDAAPLGLHLLLAATARVSGSHVYESAGVEGTADLAVREWSLGLTARWDALNVTRDRPAGFEMDAIGVGFVVKRQVFHVPRRLSLDAGVIATLLTESQSFQSTEGERSASTTDARLGLVSLARWGSSSLRGAIVLEAELSPGRARREMRIGPGFPALPAWSAGVGAGIFWGAQ